MKFSKIYIHRDYFSSVLLSKSFLQIGVHDTILLGTYWLLF